MFEKIFYNLCELMISTSLIIMIVIWILPYVDKNYGVKWRKTLWILLAIRLFIPYKISITNTLIKIPQINFNVTDNGWSMPLTIVLTFTWGIGVFVYLRMQQLNFNHFRNDIMDSAVNVKNQNIIDIFNQIKDEHHIKKVILLYHCEKVKTPMVLGVLQPVMILPYEDYSTEDITNIFHHEFMHVKKHDGWYKIFMMVITSMYWFNPFVHIMAKFSYNDVELVCDKDVTVNMNKSQRARYSETILDSIAHEKRRDLAITTCFYGNKKMMKKRIENVFDERPKRSGYPVMALIIILFVGFDSLISCGYAAAGNNTEVATFQTISEKPTETITAATTKDKRLSSINMHYFTNLTADTELCAKARDTLIGNLSPENKKTVRYKIDWMHGWIETTVNECFSDRSTDSLAWNEIYYVAESYNGAKFRMLRNDFTGVEYIQYLKEVKLIVNNYYFSLDVDRAISLMQAAIDTHEIERLYELHQIMHDLDYWLIQYPNTSKTAPKSYHEIYFGVLESYGCVE